MQEMGDSMEEGKSGLGTLLSSCRVWSWGAGTNGQLASAAFTDQLEPLPLPCFGTTMIDTSIGGACPKILDMAGGGAHGVAILRSEVTGDRKVVTWGNGHSGALGHGNESNISVPKLVKHLSDIHISSVAAGWSHTAFVAESGELYTCGNGSFGQLGHGDFESRLVPSKVEGWPCKAVSMAACGMRHTIVLVNGTSEGSAVYGFGSSKRGQLGIGILFNLKNSQQGVKTTGKVSVPRRITSLNELQIVLLAANGDHSAALSERGGLYLWGRGFGDGSDIPLPAKVQNELHFSQVALGWNHGIALADEGLLWAWGSNDRGQLGIVKGSEPYNIGSQSSVSVPTAVSFMRNDQTMMLETKGESTPADVSKRIEALGTELPLYGCKSEHHWLEMFRVSGFDGKRVRCLSAGAEHSVVVLEDGRIMTWGWGEHGQLGLGKVEDQLYPEVVPIPSSRFEENIRLRTFCGSGFTFAVAEYEYSVSS